MHSKWINHATRSFPYTLSYQVLVSGLWNGPQLSRTNRASTFETQGRLHHVASGGEQSLPPQSVSLACGLFHMKTQKAQEETLTFPLIAERMWIEDLFQEGSCHLIMLYSCGAQPFWHQGLVSWTIFYRAGGGAVGCGVWFRSSWEWWGAADEPSFSCFLLTSCCVPLIPVPNMPRTGTHLWPRGWDPCTIA